jgi:hypothetical protein
MQIFTSSIEDALNGNEKHFIFFYSHFIEIGKKREREREIGEKL